MSEVKLKNCDLCKTKHVSKGKAYFKKIKAVERLTAAINKKTKSYMPIEIKESV